MSTVIQAIKQRAADVGRKRARCDTEEDRHEPDERVKRQRSVAHCTERRLTNVYWSSKLAAQCFERVLDMSGKDERFVLSQVRAEHVRDFVALYNETIDEIVRDTGADTHCHCCFLRVLRNCVDRVRRATARVKRAAARVKRTAADGHLVLDEALLRETHSAHRIITSAASRLVSFDVLPVSPHPDCARCHALSPPSIPFSP